MKYCIRAEIAIVIKKRVLNSGMNDVIKYETIQLEHIGSISFLRHLLKYNGNERFNWRLAKSNLIDAQIASINT